METNNKETKVGLIVDEIKLYLDHLNLIAGITGKKTGDATEYSALSFGKPTAVTYRIDEDGNIIVDLNFSTINWEWNDDENFKADVDLDYAEHVNKIYTTWMKHHASVFNRKFKFDFTDFNAVGDILKEKYGIDFRLYYEEKTYSKTHVNGSEDRMSESRCVYYNVNSHMFLRGKVKKLDFDESSEYLKGR